MPKAIIADDDYGIRLVLSEAFRQEGISVTECNTLAALLSAPRDAEVIICDVLFPDGNGLERFNDIRKRFVNIPIIIMSAHNTIGTAMEALEEGAFEYIAKPFELDHIVTVVRNAMAAHAVTKGTNLKVTPATSATPGLDGCDETTLKGPDFIGRSVPMQALYTTMGKVAPTDFTVLLVGESGTGKELVARNIHAYSHRQRCPFVAVNLSALPKDLVESELFGHEKGAFTGATEKRLGRFGEAESGTLFLDEIGDMPLEAQTRLLRVLQEKVYRPVGARREYEANVRIIAATNRNLEEEVRKGRFREDLYYRLNVIPLYIPPLRERTADLSELIQHFIQKYTGKTDTPKTVTDDAIQILKAYDWPGNVRELENLIRRVCVVASAHMIDADIMQQHLGSNVLLADHKGSDRHNRASTHAHGHENNDGLQGKVRTEVEAFLKSGCAEELLGAGLYHHIMREVERPLIEAVLRKCGGNQLKASKILGINRNTLRKKITELNIKNQS